ncbi:MAG: hypothetical protein NT085_01850 [candidate division SR1 bacterium]|nr:hypothetical protein [candidate division SR1 bacterium]
MKKYFLLIALFSIAFLGLGNYSFAQNGPTINLGSNPTPGTYDSRGGNGTTPVQPEPTTMDPNQTSGQPIVTPSTPPTSSSPGGCTVVGTNIKLINDPNAENDSLGMGCRCKDGYKNINDVCKSCSDPGVCCGIQLNTSVPFIGKCIEDGTSTPSPDETGVTGATAFPTLMGSLTKILVTLILITSFVLIIVGGIMIATGNPSGGRKMIMNVVIAIALLGASGVILRLINPNFFG